MAILIDSHTKQAVRLEALGEARRQIIERLHARLSAVPSDIAGIPIFGYDVKPGMLESAFDAFLPDGNGLTARDLSDVFDDYIVMDDSEEGAEGVAVGFSSSDRCSFGFSWPVKDPDDFHGNGDPMVYKTVGKPPGEAIPGEEITDF